jgi:hypothetical protein
MLDKENLSPEKIVTVANSEHKRRVMRIEDDLENFLDEGKGGN